MKKKKDGEESSRKELDNVDETIYCRPSNLDETI